MTPHFWQAFLAIEIAQSAAVFAFAIALGRGRKKREAPKPPAPPRHHRSDMDWLNAFPTDESRAEARANLDMAATANAAWHEPSPRTVYLDGEPVVLAPLEPDAPKGWRGYGVFNHSASSSRARGSTS